MIKLQRSIPLPRIDGPQPETGVWPQTAISLSLAGRLAALIQLTKPKIMALVLITGGAANAFNQHFERDIDARMERTRQRRPLPLGLISRNEAIIFSSVFGLSGVVLLWLVFNPLTGLG